MLVAPTTIDPELVIRLEDSEISYWRKYYDYPAGLVSHTKSVAGAFLCSVPEVDILALNRVVGLGLRTDVSLEDIQTIIDFYRSNGAKRFFVQLSPFIKQPELCEKLMLFGFRHHNNWLKHYRPVQLPIPHADSEFEVSEISRDEAEVFGSVISKSFGWKGQRLVNWLSSSVGRENYHHFKATKDGEVVAVAALHVMGMFGSMAFAGTLEEYRGHGAQSLLLEKRMNAARDLGCQILVSETAEEKPGKPVASLHNMERFGFEPAYLKQNWILEL